MTLPTHIASLYETMTQEAAYDGRPAKLFTLRNASGMTATFMDIGATWLSCTLPVDNTDREVLLSYATMPQHLMQTAYFGATVGRYANRIANGRFVIDGGEHKVEANQGEHTLHGGPDGFDKRRWTVQEQTDTVIVFGLVSADGDQGFPGELKATVRFELTDANALDIQYVAECDKACPVNFTNHAYFNLMGDTTGEDCLAHRLSISADQFVPTDANGIPTGELKSVEGTGFDFREIKTLKQDFLTDEEQKLALGYDHAFLLNTSVTDGKAVAVRAVSPDNRVELEVKTTKPAVQLYTGNYLAGEPARHGEQVKHQGFCLETEFLPDAPNHPEWPGDSILKPGEQYQHQTIYQFTF
ncbi:galactose-1-epimerase [Photobacterium sanctipauli]|uniref:Aldose 1-epimerase n=1 Tax=Photobacterium sanctipauli TaxID=1342794 RepID=A0A2T3NYL0_9GAMM|nr:galactose-1-epimerase [Photobacterium sanctipauli]PSW21289.1 galactose-1-epimerase [Photobacterium sanctipauli]